MQIGKAVGKVATATSAGALVAGIFSLIYIALSFFVVSIVVFLRKDFGMRYLSVMNIFFGMFAIGWFTGVGNFIFSIGQDHVSYAIGIAYYGMIALAIYHRWSMRKKERNGQVMHSLYPGTSLIRLPGVSHETMAKWIEPALVILCGYIAGKMHDNPLRLWLMISGIGLFVHEQIAFHLQRENFLNMRDAMIESRNWSAAIQGKPAEQSQGYTIAASNREILGDLKNFSHEDIQKVLREVA